MFTISLQLVELVIVPRLERGAYERDGRGEIAEHELCADAETRAHRAALEASVLSTPVEVSLACPRAREKYCARKVSSFAPASLHSARSGRCGREHGIWGRQEARSPKGEHWTVGASRPAC